MTRWTTAVPHDHFLGGAGIDTVSYFVPFISDMDHPDRTPQSSPSTASPTMGDPANATTWTSMSKT